MKNIFLSIFAGTILFTPLFHIFANDIFIYTPEFFTSSGEYIPIRDLSISTTVTYDAQGFGGCLQSVQSIEENESYHASIYALRNKYMKYFTSLDWDKLTQPLTRCNHDSDAMMLTRIYPMQVHVNYTIPQVQKYLTNSSWKLLLGIGNSIDMIEYPNSSFSTRSNQAPDKVWYSNGTTGVYGSTSSSHIMNYLATGSGGIFSTSGNISGTGISSFSRKSWNGTIILSSESNPRKRETIHFYLGNPKTLIRGTFDVFMYPGGDNVELGLYKSNIFVKRLRKNLDYWVRPSRIEAGKYIIFHPERFYTYGDEVRVQFNPITY